LSKTQPIFNIAQLEKPFHFYAVIRHGERADKIPGLKYRNHVDPPLTQMGLLQAEFTGRYFKDLFEN